MIEKNEDAIWDAHNHVPFSDQYERIRQNLEEGCLGGSAENIKKIVEKALEKFRITSNNTNCKLYSNTVYQNTKAITK